MDDPFSAPLESDRNKGESGPACQQVPSEFNKRVKKPKFLMSNSSENNSTGHGRCNSGEEIIEEIIEIEEDSA